MNRKLQYLLLVLGLACSVTSLRKLRGDEKEPPASRVSVQLSNPVRPAIVKASVKNGGITVRGYDGREIVIEARVRAPKPSTDALRILATEQNNTVVIGVEPAALPVDLTIQVPFHTLLSIRCATNGAIFAQDLRGEIEASNQSGSVTLTNISGVVVADARNGALRVHMSEVTPNKPMSFGTVNGDIDVTLPADIKAKFKVATQNGRTESDFDLGSAKGSGEKEAGNTLILKSGGKELSLFHTTANINGGGSEVSFRTVNGNVLLRHGTKKP